MKKLFFLIATLVLLVGCKQEDQIQLESEYITFTNKLVAELTRSDNTITTNNLNSFDVWGHNDNGVAFAGTRVAKQGESWSYGEKKLWEHSTIYHFHAFAPSGVLSNVGEYPNSERMKGLSDFIYENEGNKDLVYAYATRTQGSPRRINGDPVEFSFKHLLSRVKITYKNDLSDAANVTILDTKITNAVKSAQLNTGEANWSWTSKSEGEYNFGNTEAISKGKVKATSDVVFMFPAENSDYDIEFSLVYEMDPAEPKTAVLNGVTFEKGASYNVIITINDDVVGAEKFNIEFIVVEVEEWSDYSDLNATVTDKENNDEGNGVENGDNGTSENEGESETGDNEDVGNQGSTDTQNVSGYENGYAYVDLGLSVKWATYNVGATTPDEYGSYFAWGEVEPKETYNWSTYKYGSAKDELTKYCNKSVNGKDFFTDNKTSLETEDDAATMNWGGNWRMPTYREFEELKNNCKAKWTSYNGVAGYKFTSSNGNSIFLPAAGYVDGGSVKSARTYGYYWDKNLGLNPFEAYAFYFYKDNIYYASYYTRCIGRPVRAVCK